MNLMEGVGGGSEKRQEIEARGRSLRGWRGTAAVAEAAGLVGARGRSAEPGRRVSMTRSVCTAAAVVTPEDTVTPHDLVPLTAPS